MCYISCVQEDISVSSQIVKVSNAESSLIRALFFNDALSVQYRGIIDVLKMRYKYFLMLLLKQQDICLF